MSLFSGFLGFLTMTSASFNSSYKFTVIRQFTNKFIKIISMGERGGIVLNTNEYIENKKKGVIVDK